MRPSPDPPDPTPSRLARRLGVLDATLIGLGAMVGAGIFSALAPAAAAAGSWTLAALAVAAAVAALNAQSVAQLAALHPESGGAYAYGRRRLGAWWGFLAGSGFVAGKIASCAAMALTFGLHAAPAHAHALAAAAVLASTALHSLGVEKTALATRALLAAVIAALAVVVAAGLGSERASLARALPGPGGPGLGGVLQAAGLFFFAFAGYARIATLGEEVLEPRRTIPRAIAAALGAALALYALVVGTALAVLGPERLASEPAPLAAVVAAAGRGSLEPLVRAGAALASLGVLFSLLAGVARTGFAMAAQGDLPRALAAVHSRTRVPHRAQAAVGVAVAVLAGTLDVRDAIGFSSFAVLVYYAVANATCLALRPEERRTPRALAAAGLAACLGVAFSLPRASVIAGAGVLALATLARALARRREPR